MNIKLVKNVYRIEHNQLTYDGSKIGWGPYRACHNDTTGSLTKLNDILRHNEPHTLHNLGRLTTIPMPVSWINRRPGPKEDPILREIFLEFIRSKTPTIFAFSDLQQARDWHFDDDELDILHECGFHLALYRKAIAYVGLRQTVADVESCMHGPITKYSTNILKSIKTSIPTWKWKNVVVDE